MGKNNLTLPETLGKRIKKKRKELGITLSELEILCGWKGDGARLCYYENDKREPGLDETKKIAEILGVNPWYLSYGIIFNNDKNEVDGLIGSCQNKLPILKFEEVEEWLSGKLQPTIFKEITTMSSEENTENFLPTEAHFCVHIAGDAMVSATNPSESYFQDDIAFVNKKISAKDGDVVLVRHKDSVKIRKISTDGTEIVLTALNAQYPIIPMDNEVRILGVIVSTQKNRYKQ